MGKSKIIKNPLEKDFINLLTDFGFKRVFGSKEYAGILLQFLNALFEGEMHIKSVEFKSKELLPERITGKKVQYDIYCTTDTDKHFILEMQQEESENFSSRILFYTSKAIVDQGLRGIEYELDPVYCIVITNFNLSNMRKSMVKDLMLMDRFTHEVYTEYMRIMFISLVEIPKEWDECTSELTRLLYLIKNMENMTKKSKPYLSGEYDEFFTASSTGNLTEEEAVAYSQSYFKDLENQSAVRFAESRSRAEGRAEGRVEGRAEGKMEKAIEIAKSMISIGIQDDTIMQVTGLNANELARLHNKSIE